MTKFVDNVHKTYTALYYCDDVSAVYKHYNQDGSEYNLPNPGWIKLDNSVIQMGKLLNPFTKVEMEEGNFYWNVEIPRLIKGESINHTKWEARLTNNYREVYYYEVYSDNEPYKRGFSAAEKINLASIAEVIGGNNAKYSSYMGLEQHNVTVVVTLPTLINWGKVPVALSGHNEL